MVFLNHFEFTVAATPIGRSPQLGFTQETTRHKHADQTYSLHIRNHMYFAAGDSHKARGVDALVDRRLTSRLVVIAVSHIATQ